MSNRPTSRRRILTSVILTCVALGSLGGAVDAGKGGNGGGGGKGAGGKGGDSTSSLVVVGITDAEISHTDTITFDVTTTATDQPFVHLTCMQGSTQVFTASAGFFPSYPWSQDFMLDSRAWESGGADCHARLYMTKTGTKTTTLATLDFAVGA